MHLNHKVQSYHEADDEEGLTPELWKKIQVLFHSALALPPTDRGAFLNEACGDASGLREKVDALLAADEDSNEFFRSPFITFPLIGNRVSHYQIEKKIGAGGMGEVYLARDSRLDRVV